MLHLGSLDISISATFIRDIKLDKVARKSYERRKRFLKINTRVLNSVLDEGISPSSLQNSWAGVTAAAAAAAISCLISKTRSSSSSSLILTTFLI